MAKYSFKKGQHLYCVNGNGTDAITGQTYICDMDIEADNGYEYVAIRNLDGSVACAAVYLFRFLAAPPEPEPEKPKEWVVCVDAYYGVLTLGKHYATVKRDMDFIYVKDDTGGVSGHYHHRFKPEPIKAAEPQPIAVSESTFVEMLKPYERQHYNKRQPNGLSYLKWLVQVRYPHVKLVLPAPKTYYTVSLHIGEIEKHAKRKRPTGRRLLLC